MKFTLILILVLTGLSGKFAQEHKTQDNYADFYVSTIGKDAWNGKPEEPDPEKSDGPFAKVGGLNKAVNLIKKYCFRGIYVLIRVGDYNLSGTKIWTSGDIRYDFCKIGFKDLFIPRIGITGDFPERFKDDVRTQVGTGYDNFEKLKELCKKETGAGNT